MARKRTENRIYLTPIRREQLMADCNGRCCHCGCELTLGGNFSIEHVIPLSKGGTNSYENTVALCKECNKEKGDDIVDVEFYSEAPNLVKERIAKLFEEYYENNDWLTAENVFQHDRYTIKVKQSLRLPNGKLYFKDAVCELKKMTEEDYMEFPVEERTAGVFNGDGDVEVISRVGRPFRITFKGKTVAALFCGLDARKDKTVFRIVLTVSGEIIWTTSSKMIMVDCVMEALKQFQKSVEAKGTKCIVFCYIDAPARDKRAVSVIELLSRIWEVPKGHLADPETGEICYVGVRAIMPIGVDVENGNFKEIQKKSKLYSGQIRRRVSGNQ